MTIASPANLHSDRRMLTESQNRRGESHGPLFANTRTPKTYVHHRTLPDAYSINRPFASTFSGCSMFWFDSLDGWPLEPSAEHEMALRKPVRQATGSSLTACLVAEPCGNDLR